MSLTFLVGGARSGKSALAVKLARGWEGPVTVIATAEARDEEMRERIARHRRERPPEWTTVEEPIHLLDVIANIPSEAFAIIDCLSLWVSNLLEAGETCEGIERLAERAAAGAVSRTGPTVCVSNEVGLGIVPDNALARIYRDTLGRANCLWADVADTSALVVAGRLLMLQPPDRLDRAHG